MGSYKQRCIEPYIEDNLEAFGAVLIVGPKWCGKTTTARRFAKTVVELANPQELRRYEEIADIDVSLLFRGEKPILFDEWQVIPHGFDNSRQIRDTSFWGRAHNHPEDDDDVSFRVRRF